ncbi:MAG: hypothetical protein M3471_07815 [Actinomycetota bacterium]|nr:hypothetical protein [Actinomycetota bacterium]
MGVIARLAEGAEVPLFLVVGAGGRLAADDLHLRRGVRVVDTPHAAALLVVVGRITRALLHPALVVHDQLPLPRATLWMPTDTEGDADPGGLMAAFPAVTTADVGNADELRTVFADLVSGRRPSDPPALPDMEPAHWRGVGPYGHGGAGMTGGVPFGRPLPSRAPDPDGLELDQLPLQLGPLHPALPPGLVLHVGLQGDVVRQVAVGTNPYQVWPDDPSPGPLDTALFVDALCAATPVADLELARARHHLRWASQVLRLQGLGALGRRLAILAGSLTVGDRGTVESLSRRLTKRRSLAWAMAGVGVADGELLDGLEARLVTGPVRRAAGQAEDARDHDPAYEGLGFEPVVHREADAWARFRQRLAEATQAMDLAERAGTRLRQPGPALEGPRGTLHPDTAMPTTALLELLPDLLAGMEWGDAVTTVASLDLDVEEAALPTLTPASGSRMVGIPAAPDYQNGGGGARTSP